MIVYFNMAFIEESPAEQRHGPAGAKHEEAEISRICVVKAGLLVPQFPPGNPCTRPAPGQHPAEFPAGVLGSQQFRSINTSQNKYFMEAPGASKNGDAVGGRRTNKLRQNTTGIIGIRSQHGINIQIDDRFPC